MSVVKAEARRIESLDQFRGYTVAAMLLVNFVGGFEAISPFWKHHNTYCNYPDTIMPQFLFAVGFAYRLTFLKRLAGPNPRSAYRHAVSRNLGLVLLGVVIYHLDGRMNSWAELTQLGVQGVLTTAFQREPFQTLVHIGLASIWALPVIAAGPLIRIGWLITTSTFHLALSKWFYFAWVWNRPGIDGGPLGFLTWSIPLLVGSLAFDVLSIRGPRKAIGRLLGCSLILMLLGYGLSCLRIGEETSGAPGTWFELAAPPFVAPWRPVDLWTMSQRAGSVSYQVFGAGFSMAVYALFVALCDLGSWRLGLFRTFGRNALAAYVLHTMIAGAVKPYTPRDAPLWFVLAGFFVYFSVCYLFVRHLEKNDILIRM